MFYWHAIVNRFRSYRFNVHYNYHTIANFLQVQVGRLGRSRTLSLSDYEVTSTSCVVQASMPPDSTRW